MHPNTSSHLLFIISTSPSISAKIGGISFTPETFPRKKFRKIFYINQSFGADFFLYFRCEKLWGLNTLAAPQMGGGVPFCMLPGCSPAAPFLSPIVANFQPIGVNFRQKKGQRLIFIWSVLSYPRKTGDRKEQKPNIFLKCGCKVGAGCVSIGALFVRLFGVHWAQVVQGAGASGVLRCVFRPFVPAFRPFACFARGASA